MAGQMRGKYETQVLRKNIKDQLARLLMQLADIEKQLEEFQAFLDRTLKGDMTLIDEFGAVQLAISAAIAKAFKTPEVIRLFGEKDKKNLRDRLDNITRDFKVKKITRKKYEGQ